MAFVVHVVDVSDLPIRGQQEKSVLVVRHKSFLSQVLVRLFVMIFTCYAIGTMVASRQYVTVSGFQFEAQYCSYLLAAFKFLIGANAVVFAFSLPSTLVALSMAYEGTHPRNFFFLFLHDIVMMVLMISACGAATSIDYVSSYGNTRLGLRPICDHLDKFCNGLHISLILSYFAFFSFLTLTINSALKFRQPHLVIALQHT